MSNPANVTEKILVLLDVRSVQNTASLFRTADCVGVSRIILVGTTPQPIDRFGRERSDFKKISLGAEKTVSYKYASDIHEVLRNLKEQSVEIVALEQDKNSIDYHQYTPSRSFALIVGNEVSGVPQDVLEQCDVVIEIPMRGQKESLNVSIAGVVALFHLM